MLAIASEFSPLADHAELLPDEKVIRYFGEEFYDLYNEISLKYAQGMYSWIGVGSFVYNVKERDDIYVVTHVGDEFVAVRSVYKVTPGWKFERLPETEVALAKEEFHDNWTVIGTHLEYALEEQFGFDVLAAHKDDHGWWDAALIGNKYFMEMGCGLAESDSRENQVGAGG